MSQDVSFQKSTKVWFSMTTGILKSLNPRNRNSISVISTKFLFVSSMNTLLATLKVTDARRDVILTGGLNHRFPWRPSPTPGSSITWYNAKLEIKYPSYSPSVNLNIGQVLGHIYEQVWSVWSVKGLYMYKQRPFQEKIKRAIPNECLSRLLEANSKTDSLINNLNLAEP